MRFITSVIALMMAIPSTTDILSSTDSVASISAGCVANRHAMTRWRPEGRGYGAVASYGRAMEDWIGSVAGLGYRDGRLFLLDRGDPRVVVLSAEDMLALSEFGRIGQGPGEFERPLVPWAHRGPWSFWYLAVTASEIVVYDGEAIEIFDHSGDFLRRQSGLARDPLFGLRYVATLGNGGPVAYAFDNVSRGFRGARQLETWVMSDNGPRKVWSVPIPDPPHSGAGYVTPVRQAKPLWAVSGSCVLVSDGSSRKLLRFNVETRTVDTLALPDWTVPGISEETRERGDARARAGLPGADLEPTSLLVWTDLTIDPDGFVWVELWREDRERPARVAIVDPDSGAITEVSVPTFPKAFGPPGTFYGVRFDDETDLPVVVKYDLQDRRGEIDGKSQH